MNCFAVIIRFKTKGGILSNTSIAKPERDDLVFQSGS